MRKLLIVSMIAVLGGPAFSQTPAPAPAPTFKLEMTEQEINTSIQLFDIACKQLGMNQGCREAIYLTDKLNESRKPKTGAPAAAAEAPKK